MKTDVLGQILNIGDYVVYMVKNYRELDIGTVKKIGNKMVTVEMRNGETLVQHPNTLVRIDENDAIRAAFEKTLKS